MVIKKRFGDILVDSGTITSKQLDEAISYQKENGIRIGQAFVELGYLTEDIKLRVLSEQLNLETIDIETLIVNEEILSKFSKEEMKTHTFIPYDISDIYVKVVVSDPFNIVLEDLVSARTNLPVEFVLVKDSELATWIEKNVGSDIISKDIDRIEGEAMDDEAFELDDDENSPVIKIVNNIIKDAVHLRASDIHIMPKENVIDIRYRIDGTLRNVMELPSHTLSSVVTRIKAMAKMNISEKRKPLSGRIETSIDNRRVDLRISTLPTIYGEKVVIRILDQSNLRLDIENLGLDTAVEKKFMKLIKNPTGIILLTGPTGSGKTSTLFTVLNELNSIEKNIITIEDPVEYKLDGISQVQVNDKAGLGFAEGLREILRQDPDIILIGEIRDTETAGIAITASNTGHLVLSTLHTNDSASSITRLVDMGIAPYLVSDTLLGVMNQRLVKNICEKCKEEYYLEENTDEREDFGLHPTEPIKAYRGKGCNDCNNTGYKGRIPIQELLIMSKDIRVALNRNASSGEIKDIAIKNGMITLKSDGLSKALSGRTTLSEVRKAVSITE